jgi:hypothetical protein
MSNRRTIRSDGAFTTRIPLGQTVGIQVGTAVGSRVTVSPDGTVSSYDALMHHNAGPMHYSWAPDTSRLPILDRHEYGPMFLHGHQYWVDYNTGACIREPRR